MEGEEGETKIIIARFQVSSLCDCIFVCMHNSFHLTCREVWDEVLEGFKRGVNGMFDDGCVVSDLARQRLCLA